MMRISCLDYPNNDLYDLSPQRQGMKRKCTTHKHFLHPETKKEYEAQLVLQQFSEHDDVLPPDNLETRRSLKRPSDTAENITTWNPPAIQLVQLQPAQESVKQTKVKHRTFYRNRSYFRDVPAKVDSHKIQCRQERLQAHLQPKNTRKTTKINIVTERPKCAINMLSPQFKQLQYNQPRAKAKSFYFSGSLLNRVYLCKDKEPSSHEKQALAFRRIKSDLVNWATRTKNNSTYSTIMEESMRVASEPTEQKTASSKHFNLCLVTEGGDDKTKEELLPKAPRHISIKTNRTVKSKKILFTARGTHRPQIFGSLLKTGNEFTLLHRLLTRQKLQ